MGALLDTFRIISIGRAVRVGDPLGRLIVPAHLFSRHRPSRAGAGMKLSAVQRPNADAVTVDHDQVAVK